MQQVTLRCCEHWGERPGGGGEEDVVRTLLLPLTVRSCWAYLTACLMHDPLLVACRTDPARYTSGIAVPIGRIRRHLL